MKHMARFGVIAAISALALLGVSIPAHATEDADTEVSSSGAVQTFSFSDVTPGMPFYDEILWLATQGVSTGWPDGTYRPYLPVTRDAMAAFMYRLAGSPAYTPPVESPFADVPTSYQFYTEISWLAASGISTGWQTAAGREFRPWNFITRDAMAAFLYRYKGSPAYTPAGSSPFTDMVPGAAFEQEIRWLAAQGISTGWDLGYGCREFRPFGNVSRDAMAAFMYRATNGGTGGIESGTCSAPPPGSSVVTNPVTPGAFCKKEITGWYGRTVTGVLMRCTLLAGESGPRWRAA